MPSRNRPRSLSRCGRGERLIGSGRNTKPSEQRAKCQTMPTNIDTDSSIVSLTSSTNSVRHNETKPKPEPNKDAMKDTNSMLSTDLYPTRDIEAEQVIRAELKNARVPREDQSTDDSAMKPIIVSEENYMAYGKTVPGRLRVRTKSRLKDDRAPRASRERLPRATTKPLKQSKSLKLTKGGKRSRPGTARRSSKESRASDDKKTPAQKDTAKGEVEKPTKDTSKEIKSTEDKANSSNEAVAKKFDVDPVIKGGKEGTDKKCCGLPPPKDALVAAKEPAKCPAAADLNSKASVVRLSSDKCDTSHKRTNVHSPLCKSWEENTAQRSPGAKQPTSRRTKRKKRRELFKKNIERIKANMKRAEILCHPSAIKYCESSSSFSTSSRIEFSE